MSLIVQGPAKLVGAPVRKDDGSKQTAFIHLEIVVPEMDAFQAKSDKGVKNSTFKVTIAATGDRIQEILNMQAGEPVYVRGLLRRKIATFEGTDRLIYELQLDFGNGITTLRPSSVAAPVAQAASAAAPAPAPAAAPAPAQEIDEIPF
jgi:hypothetical protein